MKTVVAALLVVAACGGEAATTTDGLPSTTAASTTTTTAAPTTTQAITTTSFLGVSNETQAFCDSMVRLDALLSGLDPPNPADVEMVASEAEALAPSDLEASLSTFLLSAEAAASAGDPGLLNTDEANVAAGEIESFMGAECGYQSLGSISTYEAYDNDGDLVEASLSLVDTEVPAGTYEISFVNVGLEAHDLAILRINDGVTESASEILALPNEEAGAKATYVRDVLLMPGNYDSTYLALEAGRYIFFCPVPAGSTPETFSAIESGEMEGGPLHFTLGELVEVTVTD